MSGNTQKRLAADILKVGESRIWIDQESHDEVAKAITRADIKSLIAKNIIQVKPKIGVSRGRAKALHAQRLKGRRRGPGQRKGTKNARMPRKRAWINKIRPLRRMLRGLRGKGKLTSKLYRDLYNKSRGNFFRSRSHLKSHIEKIEQG